MFPDTLAVISEAFATGIEPVFSEGHVAIGELSVVGRVEDFWNQDEVSLLVENVETVISALGNGWVFLMPVQVSGFLRCVTPHGGDALKFLGGLQSSPGTKIVVENIGAQTGTYGLVISSSDSHPHVGPIQLFDSGLLLSGNSGALTIDSVSLTDRLLVTTESPVRIITTSATVHLDRVSCERAGALNKEMIKTGIPSPIGLHLSLGRVDWTVRGAVNTGLYNAITNMVTDADPGVNALFSASLVLP